MLLCQVCQWIMRCFWFLSYNLTWHWRAKVTYKRKHVLSLTAQVFVVGEKGARTSGQRSAYHRLQALCKLISFCRIFPVSDSCSVRWLWPVVHSLFYWNSGKIKPSIIFWNSFVQWEGTPILTVIHKPISKFCYTWASILILQALGSPQK